MCGRDKRRISNQEVFTSKLLTSKSQQQQENLQALTHRTKNHVYLLGQAANKEWQVFQLMRRGG